VLFSDYPKHRCTFTYGDSSHRDANSVYTFKYPYFICDSIDSSFVTKLLNKDYIDYYKQKIYVEIQIHGDIKLDRDVHEIRASEQLQKNEHLLELSHKNNIPIRWYKSPSDKIKLC